MEFFKKIAAFCGKIVSKINHKMALPLTGAMKVTCFVVLAFGFIAKASVAAGLAGALLTMAKAIVAGLGGVALMAAILVAAIAAVEIGYMTAVGIKAVITDGVKALKVQAERTKASTAAVPAAVQATMSATEVSTYYAETLGKKTSAKAVALQKELCWETGTFEISCESVAAFMVARRTMPQEAAFKLTLAREYPKLADAMSAAVQKFETNANTAASAAE